MYPVITPKISTQLINAVNLNGLMAGSYHVDRLRSEIDHAKCLKSNNGLHLVRNSLIRKITAQRYRELRRTWNMLTS